MRGEEGKRAPCGAAAWAPTHSRSVDVAARKRSCADRSTCWPRTRSARATAHSDQLVLLAGGATATAGLTSILDGFVLWGQLQRQQRQRQRRQLQRQQRQPRPTAAAASSLRPAASRPRRARPHHPPKTLETLKTPKTRLRPPPLARWLRPLQPSALRAARRAFWGRLADFVALGCAPAPCLAELRPSHPSFCPSPDGQHLVLRPPPAAP